MRFAILLLALAIEATAASVTNRFIVADATSGAIGWPTNFWDANSAAGAANVAIARRYSAASGRGANLLRGFVNAARIATDSDTYHLLIWGDSWIHGLGTDFPTWLEMLTPKLQASLGSRWAGYGYCPASRGPSPGVVPYARVVPCSYTGSWVPTTPSTVVRGPSQTHMNAMDAGATITWTFSDSVPIRINIIHLIKSGGGDFCYRFNSESWSTNVATAGSDGIGVVSVTSDLPVAAPYTFTVMATNLSTGGVGISGIYHRSAASGLVVNNLGSQGDSIKQFYDWSNGTTTVSNALVVGLEVPTTANRTVSIVSVGTNDINDSTESDYLSRLNAFIGIIEGYCGSNMQWAVITPSECDRNDGSQTTRPTDYYPVIVSNVTEDAGATVVPVVNADDWFGNLDRTSMRPWLDMTGGLHLGHLGAGVFCANVSELLGL